MRSDVPVSQSERPAGRPLSVTSKHSTRASFPNISPLLGDNSNFLQLCPPVRLVTAKNIPRGCSIGYVQKYTVGVFSVNTLPNVTGVCGAAAIPIRTIRKRSVRTRYRQFGKFGTTSTPICDTSGSSVWPRRWYPTLR